MSARAKNKPQEDRQNNLREHTVISWTLDEYLQAVKHEELYKLVEPYLDIDPKAMFLDGRDTTSGSIKEGKVRCKYYLAGGSCRYMFEQTGQAVTEELNAAVSKASDISGIFRGNVGSSSQVIVNRLISIFVYEQGLYKAISWMPVSRYAARILAVKAEVSVLKQLTSEYGMRHSAMKGLLFEMLFFKGLNAGMTLTYRNDDKQPDYWEPCNILSFAELPRMQTLARGRTCLQPYCEFQGGYDGVIVDKENRQIQFVQVTIAAKHSFKLSFFLKALEALGVPTTGWKVRIIFVTVRQRLASLQIGPVKDRGALEKYGWKKGQEEEKAEKACFRLVGSVMDEG
eukprot:766003-Hanusia_phi.AAC.1